MDEADRQTFLALQRDFVAGLGARMAQILGGDAQARDQALHMLAGAAGAYDLEALGVQARQVQAAIRAGDAAQTAAQLQALAAQVGQLQGG